MGGWAVKKISALLLGCMLDAKWMRSIQEMMRRSKPCLAATSVQIAELVRSFLLEGHQELLILLLVEVVNMTCKQAWHLQNRHPCLDVLCSTCFFFFFKKKSQNAAISQNSRSPIWDVHQFYVMKIVLRFVSRGVPGPCRIYQRVYLFWIHTLRRFFVNGCLALDKISWSWLSTCRTVLSNPVRHFSVDTELMRGVNDSE